ncbi:DarT ssDNA thymidine ADP-ribosyltransferase family protein [Tabrizicola oligotrophica]|uniref:DUF4433 domain-containing protein n=1 Tax=Tabrizicola oligotrophica TaxID=2710650 RepID=A0A6M0QNK9_9RHOB|nr:DarT ssDNA thymidine ADP-ribosyltransferase family protein [Tabrizicola oligotrophica]NEY88671.1 DUF4433 domain-containing protein [Tabrizicola oligotrophica]
MTAVVFVWTAFTFLAAWATWLVLLQLATAWGTAWLMSSLFGKQGSTGKNPERSGKVPVATQQPLVPWAPISSSKPASVALEAKSLSHPDDGGRDIQQPSMRKPGFLEETNSKLLMEIEKLKTNEDFRRQLYGLRISIEVVLECGEREKRIAIDPEFAEEFEKVRQIIGSGEPEGLELSGVSLLPVQRSSLPPLVAQDRIQKLKDILDFLEKTHRRASQDVVLLEGVNKRASEPFLPFIKAQIDLLSQHLLLLSPPEAPHTASPTTGSSEGPNRKSGLFHVANRTTVSLLDTVTRMADEAHPTTVRTDSCALAGASNSLEQVTGSVSKANSPTAKPRAVSSNKVTDAVRPTERARIELVARELRIPHLVHFTRCENLLGILQHGLMSMTACEKKGLLPTRNDTNRFDAQTDGTSLSVTFPNYRMFWKYRQIMPDADWAILLISPRVLWEKDCAFYSHNAADARMIRLPREQMKSVQALRDMFAAGEGGRDAWLRPYDPTDPQAEVMVYETIEPDLVEAIAFETAEAQARHLPYLAHHESFHAGRGKGLFASRKHVRMN